MAEASYQQFCPVAMAAEILGTRWTMIVLRELVAGSTRFNELRRGIPKKSPALLSKRLKELEAAGVVMRRPIAHGADVQEYRLTAAGRELAPVIESIGIWGHRWIETRATLAHLDLNLLMWDIRRNIDPTPMPSHRCTIQIIFADLAQSQRNWWLVITPQDGVDLCSIDPGFDVDLYIETDLRTMTEVWMGYIPVSTAQDDGRFVITGDPALRASLLSWFRLSTFAKVDRLVA